MIGGGGHASVLTDILLEQGREIIAIISSDNINSRKVFSGLPHLCRDDDIKVFHPSEVILVNGLGMMPKSSLREDVGSYFKGLGYRFEQVIASNACVSKYASIGEGVQVLSQAVVHSGAQLGAHSIINTASIIEHDCVVGANNHICPRATLCGQVKTRENVYVGAGASIIQGVHLYQNVIVGAGAVVTEDISRNQICYPRRIIIKSY